MANVNPYVNFNGNCEEAFNFYKSAFGTEFAAVMRFGDMPMEGMPAEKADLLMHIALPIGNTVLMGSDWGLPEPKFNQGNTFSISIQSESEAETDTLFNALSAGGKVTMPLSKVPWNAYFGMFIDKYGINWLINYDMNTK